MAFILAGPTQEIRRGQDEKGNRLNTYQALYLKGNTCLFRGYLDEVHEASQGQGRQLGGICG